ncbi:MAG: vitamin K epoxide reductase family protein [Anaerolineales bacterium]|nr:vitamin K epoxide reductase family protein [Anaerolineales bacterium]
MIKTIFYVPGGRVIRSRNTILAILIILISLFPLAAAGNAQEPVIRAVLFYSESCPHCLEVIDNVLPPLVDQYGTQLQIFGTNTYSEIGNTLYVNAIQAYGIPQERQGVPTLIVGDTVLVGSFEIPDQLPGIIEQGLENGGIDWPNIPDLEQVMSETEPGEEENTSTLDHPMTVWERFSSDLLGNILSVIVLVGMIGALIFAGINLGKDELSDQTQIKDWLIPTLSLIGLGVAGYLAYVEINQVEAICGPVGNCNTVQQSSYAMLFGIFPIGVLGVLGYLVMIILWLAGNFDSEVWQKTANILLWIISLIGVLFSVYLTFLEPFVIGATCLWCISSAVIMTILFLLATQIFKQSLVIVPEES